VLLKRFLIIFFTCSISAGCRSWTKETFAGNILHQEVHADGSRRILIHPLNTHQNIYDCAISSDTVKSLGEKRLNYADFANLEGFSERTDSLVEQMNSIIEFPHYRLNNCKVVSIANKDNTRCPIRIPGQGLNIDPAKCCDVNSDMTLKKISTCNRG
jgi:hypothetical protein